MKKAEWIALFEEVGLTENQMHDWHRAFEARHPQDHQSFLEWLNLKPAEVDAIRKRFQ